MNLWIAGLMFPALFLLIFQGMPVAFALILPAFLAGWYAFGPMVFDQMYGALYGAATNHILSAIPMFVLMGALLERSGIAARLFRTMQLWLGGLPGGLAIATIAMAANKIATLLSVTLVREDPPAIFATPYVELYGEQRALISVDNPSPGPSLQGRGIKLQEIFKVPLRPRSPPQPEHVRRANARV